MKKRSLLVSLFAMSFVGMLNAQQILQVRVSQATDDMEEYIVGGVGQTQNQILGTMDAGSSDLELGCESTGNVDPQLIGIRFSSVNLPQGVYITNAYIEFTVDATNKNTDPCNLTVKAQDSDSPLTFDDTTRFNVSSRPMLMDSVDWAVSGTTWGTVGSHGTEQQTPNLKNLVQQLIDRAGWVQGNAMTFFINGTGLREIESYDGSSVDAPLLVIEYAFKNTEQVRVNAPEDDLEEYIPGVGQTQPLGSMDPGSSDLELGAESSNNVDPQLVGIRFSSVNIPANAPIINAYIEFTVDATNKNSDPCNLTIKAQDDINSLSFDANNPFNISSRPMLMDSVNWAVSGATWGTVGSHGTEQQTPNLKTLVEALVAKPGWVQGSPMTFFVEGTGLREIESYDGDPGNAALLVIEYLSDGCIGIPTTDYPVSKSDSWYYDYSGSTPDVNWTKPNFNDTCWSNGSGAFGYNAASLNSTLDYGSDVNNKPITAYFRKHLNIADINTLGDTLEVNVRVNDGFAFYINETEVIRYNLPGGTLTETTLANSVQPLSEHTIYYTFNVLKSAFTNGHNILAAEVHQSAANSNELIFDMEIKEKSGTPLTEAYGCISAMDDHISCFTSVAPRGQNDTVDIPFDTHVFQYLYKKGQSYTDGNGTVPGNFDFTGYVGIGGSSKLGYLSVNHENSPGGVSICDIHFNDTTGLWVMDASRKVDFGGDLVKTERNCSGTVTPWGTIITSEESTTTADANSDNYHDLGWHVEIDPVTAEVKEYGNGKKEKLWKMGKMSHENVVIHSDEKTAYYGEDSGSGMVWKFVADVAQDLSSGTLYVLKLDQPLVGGEPQVTVGSWVMVDNSTPTLCNNAKSAATGLGATTINGVEDVEISPLDGKVYFTAKGTNRIYRFKDDGSTVSEFETFIGGNNNYLINAGNGKVISEAWGSGNDNLTFDDRGNLYVLQDGSRNHIWMVYPDHTQASPKVEVFMVTPTGSEPTGMTFSPDYRYMFVSIQHPSGSIPQTDVSGDAYTYSGDAVLVVSRKEYLGVPQLTTSIETLDKKSTIEVFPNPFNDYLNVKLNSISSTTATIQLFDINGREVMNTLFNLNIGTNQVALNTEKMDNGIYFIKVSTTDSVTSTKVILSR